MKGQMIGQYKIVDTIYETEYSCLYQAVECVDGREEAYPYALKRLNVQIHPELTLQKERDDSQEIANYTRENIIVEVIKVISHEGQNYAVMKYERHGKFLGQLILELEQRYGAGKIPLYIQLELLQQMIHTVHVLHHCKASCCLGYLHMDLHPGNIFLENCTLEPWKTGSAKLIDLQNALPLNEAGEAYGREHLAAGSVGFAAPEQMLPGRVVFTEAADLYGIAAIGARIFTGIQIKSPFQSYDTVIEEGQKPDGMNGLLYDQMRRFLLLGLERNPHYRFQTAQELGDAVAMLQKLVRQTEEEQYYALFSAAYRQMVPLESLVPGKQFSSERFSTAVDTLYHYMRLQDHDTDRSHYIFQALWQMKCACEDCVSMQTLYRLIQCGIESCNYQGASYQALELFQELEQKKSQMPLMDYLGLTNYAAEIYIDTYRYEEAKILTEQTFRNLKQMKNYYKKVAVQCGLDGNASTNLRPLADACCNLGRYMTFLHEDGASDYFAEAYGEYGEDRDARDIVLSHMLHDAIEQRDIRYFERYGEEYLGINISGKTVRDCLEFLSEKGAKTSWWRLWVFLKALYRLYLPNVLAEREQCFQLLRQLLRKLAGEEGTVYPLELIYKYIGILLYETGGQTVTEEVREAFERSLGVYQGDWGRLTIRRVMQYQTESIYHMLQGEEEKNEKLYRQLLAESCKFGWNDLTKRLQSGADLTALLEYEHC